jgi:Uma2 family endonuclease
VTDALSSGGVESKLVSMGKLKEFHRDEASPTGIPPLENGDRLSLGEFERRHEAMPHLKKAELIEGVVYMPSPVREQHGDPHSRIITWLGTYAASRDAWVVGCETTLRLDLENEFQPDAYLRIRSERGGRSRTGPDGFLEGPPELLAEVAVTSASIDLHAKMRVYRRSGVAEYIVWRVRDGKLEWFSLREGEYVALPLDSKGSLKSEVFPGLWLDPAAILEGDMKRVLEVVEPGIRSPEHGAFIRALEARVHPGEGSSR